jgi:hypothetical protein
MNKAGALTYQTRVGKLNGQGQGKPFGDNRQRPREPDLQKA